MSKPDNCKFCGSGSFLDERFYPVGTEHYYCGCNSCGCRTPTFKSKDEAIAAWNRKPEPEHITPEGLERLGFIPIISDSDVLIFDGSAGFVLTKIERDGDLAMIDIYTKESRVILSADEFSKLTLDRLKTLIDIFVD